MTISDGDRETLQNAGYQVMPTCGECSRSGSALGQFTGFCRHLGIEVRDSGQCLEFQLDGCPPGDDHSEAAHGSHTDFYNGAALFLRQVMRNTPCLGNKDGFKEIAANLKAQADKAMEGLTEREREVVQMRFRATAMSQERASTIVRACVANKLYSMGLDDELPLPLHDYSLSDLLKANHMIATANKNSDSHQMVCDDRLVAALYTIQNYEASPLDDMDPIARIDGKALCCVASGDDR